MNKILARVLLLILIMPLSGCLLTKVVTVPMRVVGAAASAVPTVGDAVDETIDETADTIDTLPF